MLAASGINPESILGILEVSSTQAKRRLAWTTDLFLTL
jgi:hypothetical protein